MPVDLVFYKDDDESVPVRDWLDTLPSKVQDKFAARTRLLKQMGHSLRRPIADYLRNGIYELRVRVGRKNHRILYFFHGRNIIVLSNGLTKEKVLKPERIKYWLSVGAKPSDTVHNLLIGEKIIEGGKTPVHKKAKKRLSKYAIIKTD